MFVLYTAGGLNIPVSSPTSPSILGFTSSFRPSRSGAATSTEGLTEGDIFGYAGGDAAASVGADPTEGAQVFFAEDTDGEVTITFAPVSLTGVAPMFSMDFIVDGTFEFDNGANDRVYIRLDVSACPAATTVSLFDSDGGGSGGGVGNDMDFATVNGAIIVDKIWNSLTEDLTPYTNCVVQLVIEVDMNASTEECAFDNINFTAGIALPVEFTSIAANQRKDVVLLDWSTATETDNRGFSVERSLDGRSFAPIGWVDGTGEAQAQVDYEFEDNSVRVGQAYYYRLRQEDFDGAFAYSSIVKVTVVREANEEVAGQFFPNPAVLGQSNIELYPAEASDWTLAVVDVNGRLLTETKHTLAAGYNLVPVNLAKHPIGAYLIRIAGKEQTVYRRVIR